MQVWWAWLPLLLMNMQIEEARTRVSMAALSGCNSNSYLSIKGIVTHFIHIICQWTLTPFLSAFASQLVHFKLLYFQWHKEQSTFVHNQWLLNPKNLNLLWPKSDKIALSKSSHFPLCFQICSQKVCL